jgi:dienelactone hydrolase
MAATSVASTIVAEAVTIPTRRGSRLFGVVSRPAVPPMRHRAIVISCAGLTRTGLGDVIRILGERLAERGFLVLRFDPSGTGDSPGDELADDISLSEYRRRVQDGVFTNDIADAVAWVQYTHRPQDVCLLGVCAASASALTVASVVPSVVSRVALLTPVILYPPRADADVVRDFDAPIRWRGYFRRLVDPAAYGKFFTGRSDYATIAALLKWAVRRPHHVLRRLASRLDRTPRPTHPEFSPCFWDGFRGVMARATPMLVLLSELDDETLDFLHEFKQPVIDKHPAYSSLCDVQILRGTDHLLTAEDGRALMLERLLAWLAVPASALGR